MAGGAACGALEVRLLGPFEVLRDGAVLDVPRGRLRVLLASLALSAGQVVAVGDLMAQLWGEQPPARARSSLYNTVTRLRGLVGADVVRTVGGGYVLDVDPDRVDALRFLRLAGAARQVSEAGDADELLREALGLWRGDPLTGVDSEPLRRDQGASLLERYLTVVERLFDADLAAGRGTGLIEELRGLTSRFPLRESLWVRLLSALHAAGRTAEALETYHGMRGRLAEELGTDPSVELQRAYQRILTEDSAGAVAVLDSGPASVAGAVGSGPPRQLPPDVSRFVGRERELAALDALLEAGDEPGKGSVRIGVVHGIGGVGKTALAVHWAHRVASRFPDGQLYLNLQGYGPQAALSAEAALGALLRSLGLPERAVPVGVAERAALLRTRLAGRRVLVLLDNARQAEQVRPLLPGEGCVVLVTSRSQMRGLGVREGASRIVLGEMGESEAERLVSQTVADRRQASAAEVSALVGLCGRLPLALRIAAELTVRYPDGSLAELVDDLRAARLEALADPDDPAADPRAVFSWSYQTLTVQDARVFRQLGLHPGSEIGLFAAAALVGRPVAAARRLLDRLVAVHLLEEHGQGRYQFHDLVREYAAERAVDEDSPEERDTAVRRVLSWYLQTADTASHTLSPGQQRRGRDVRVAVGPGLTFADAAAALRWYDGERAALVAAVRRAAEVGADDIAWRLADTLDPYYIVRPVWDEWADIGEVALAAAQRTGEPIAQAVVLTSIGNLRSLSGDNAEALGYYRWALRLFRDAGAGPQEASVLALIASVRMEVGEYDDAQRLFGESIAISEKIGEAAREAQAHSNLSIVYLDLGRYADALRSSERAKDLWQGVGDRRGAAHALDNMGDAYVELGESAKAADCYSESLSIVRSLRDRRGEGIYLANLARAQRHLEADSRAQPTAEAAQPTAEAAPTAEPALPTAEVALPTAEAALAALASFTDTEVNRIRERLHATFPELGEPGTS